MGSRQSLVESVAGEDTAESDDHELEGTYVQYVGVRIRHSKPSHNYACTYIAIIIYAFVHPII